MKDEVEEPCTQATKFGSIGASAVDVTSGSRMMIKGVRGSLEFKASILTNRLL